MSPVKQLEAISVRAHQMLDALYALVMRSLLPSLSSHGVRLLTISTLDLTERVGMAAYFRQEVLPALTPLAIDFERPFPMLSSLSVNVAFCLAAAEGETWQRLAIVQVPARLARLVRVPGATPTFVLLDDLIRAEGAALFPGQTIVESVAFRLTRDSELEVDDEGGESTWRSSRESFASVAVVLRCGWSSRLQPATSSVTGWRIWWASNRLMSIACLGRSTSAL